MSKQSTLGENMSKIWGYFVTFFAILGGCFTFLGGMWLAYKEGRKSRKRSEAYSELYFQKVEQYKTQEIVDEFDSKVWDIEDRHPVSTGNHDADSYHWSMRLHELGRLIASPASTDGQERDSAGPAPGAGSSAEGPDSEDASGDTGAS